MIKQIHPQMYKKSYNKANNVITFKFLPHQIHYKKKFLRL